MTANKDNLGLNALRRILLILAIIAFVGTLVAIAATILMGHVISPLTDEIKAVLSIPVLLTSFAGAFTIFLIGWVRTAKWMFATAWRIRPDVRPYQYLFNRFNVVFLPSLLTPEGLNAGQKLGIAFAWLLAGSGLILLTFAIAHFGGIDAL